MVEHPACLILIAVIGFAICVLGIVLNNARVVPEHHAGIVERSGKFVKVLEQGFYWITPPDTLYLMDMREQEEEINVWQIITADKVNMTISATIYYQIIDPQKARYEVINSTEEVIGLSKTSLKDIACKMISHNILSSRDVITTKMKEFLNEATTEWGIKVNRIEVKDINTV